MSPQTKRPLNVICSLHISNKSMSMSAIHVEKSIVQLCRENGFQYLSINSYTGHACPILACHVYIACHLNLRFECKSLSKTSTTLSKTDYVCITIWSKYKSAFPTLEDMFAAKFCSIQIVHNILNININSIFVPLTLIYMRDIFLLCVAYQDTYANYKHQYNVIDFKAVSVSVERKSTRHGGIGLPDMNKTALNTYLIYSPMWD